MTDIVMGNVAELRSEIEHLRGVHKDTLAHLIAAEAEIERLRAEAETMRADCERELREAYAEYVERAEEKDAEIEGLREQAEMAYSDGYNIASDEAKAEIERLRAENQRNADGWQFHAANGEKLHKEIERLRSWQECWRDDKELAEALDEIVQLKAEIDRLRGIISQYGMASKNKPMILRSYSENDEDGIFSDIDR